jgi:hypothetical protein
MTCDEFRDKHRPDVKFAELPVAMRQKLFEHYRSCPPCQFFINTAPLESQDTFDAEALAASDARAFGVKVFKNLPKKP